MKSLEMNQMEQIEGGIDCETAVGVAAGTIVGGVLIAATGGIGAFFAGWVTSSVATTVAAASC